MHYEYRNVSTHTLEGLKEAERLKAAGWQIVRTGLFMVYFRKVQA
jgi:hypothetical protein